MKQKSVVLLVVSVGCGLLALFLTSQMMAKGRVEQVEVIVAAKDLPVGTMLSRDELKTAVKLKTLPKEGLPPTVVTSMEELLDKRLSRPLRADETFNPADLSKGGVITLPEGYDMASLQINAAAAAAGFIGPGSRVNVNATLRLSNKLLAFPLLVNMLVVAVDTNTSYSKDGTFPTIGTVSFAVKEKEALLLSLAKSRGCTIELLLRNNLKSTDADKTYNMEEVLKLLQDDQNPGGIKGVSGEPEKPKPADPVKPAESPVKPAEVPVVAMKKVLLATRDIPPHTDVTNDLVKEAFELKDLPKEFAGDALGDLTDALGKQFKTGVAKGQWVTPNMIGIELKAPPVDIFVPKEPTDPKSPPPVAPPVAVKRKIHDVSVHSASGIVVHRYEEVAPGQWKKIAELSPEQASKDEKPDAPKAAPEATPNAKRKD